MTSHDILEACKSMFQIHESVQKVSILGLDGKELYSVGREGMRSKEPENATEALFVKLAIGRGMAESENGFHGRLKSIAISREKLTLVIFMTFDKILVISAEPDFPLDKIVKLGELVDKLQIGEQPSESSLQASTFKE
jgi:hypothetical protein